MSINDGGPAFPAERMEGLHNLVTDTTDFQRVQYPGMSLRDWLAGQALAGLLANDNELSQPKIEAAQQCIAQLSYGYADAMLAERSKP